MAKARKRKRRHASRVARKSDQETVPRIVSPKKKAPKRSRRVFIVHGREPKPVKQLKSILEQIGLEPIVLHEQPSGSRTVIEKLEKHSKNVSYAFVILTPDDSLVNLATARVLRIVDESEAQTLSRKERSDLFLELSAKTTARVARQNVILEFGYFVGKLGRDHVCCLYKGHVQLPSDMQGIVCVPFENSVKEAKKDILKELKAVGLYFAKKLELNQQRAPLQVMFARRGINSPYS